MPKNSKEGFTAEMGSFVQRGNRVHFTEGGGTALNVSLGRKHLGADGAAKINQLLALRRNGSAPQQRTLSNELPPLTFYAPGFSDRVKQSLRGSRAKDKKG